MVLSIIGAEGCVVLDEFLHNGRRARRDDGKGFCKNKPPKSQRIGTQRARPLHPNAKAAMELIRSRAWGFEATAEAAADAPEQEERDEEEATDP